LRSVDPLVVYLRDVGALEAPKPPLATPVSELLVAYRSWLIDDRGLAPPTVLRYENAARRFLGDRFAVAGDRFIVDLEAADVTGFLVAECGRVSLGAAKGRVAELRSLLRFLFLKGWTPRPLGVAIPPVAGWHDTTIPTGIAAGDVERLIASCDRSTAIGARDVAVLLLVARLGLRSAEVARLELGDIDWRVGELVVRGKARRQDRLPLPHDIGEALSTYLTGVRPATATRRVFLTAKAPIQPLRPDRVSDITRRACARVGIAEVGAHRSGTPWPRNCCVAVPPSSRSARCCVTAIWPPPPSTPRSISTRCAKSHSHGQEHCDERARRPGGRVSAAATATRP
jgi:integrase